MDRIKTACRDAGTYQPYFDDVIETLSGIMETRDAAREQFLSMGGKPVVVHKNKGGFENPVKNPALVIIQDCNTQALAYWKELGLTAKAYQSMQKNGFQKKEGTFEDLLKNIGI